MSEAAARIPFAALGASSGFQGDLRFAPLLPGHQPPDAPPDDPLAVAWADGFAAGEEAARAQVQRELLAEATAHKLLELAFAKLDNELTETLSQRLRNTVAVLCETALAPLALDEAALAGRIERAMAMFQRADDERVLRLHPDDLALVSAQMQADWKIEADSTLLRGALRIEAANGGVEDGPAQWRQAIAEALH
jgi:flagellar assembly protein FliH